MFIISVVINMLLNILSIVSKKQLVKPLRKAVFGAYAISKTVLIKLKKIELLMLNTI